MPRKFFTKREYVRKSLYNEIHFKMYRFNLFKHWQVTVEHQTVIRLKQPFTLSAENLEELRKILRRYGLEK